MSEREANIFCDRGVHTLGFRPSGTEIAEGTNTSARPYRKKDIAHPWR